ncbi:aromatic ring-hydroxylating oxygenase subunit alpha [Flavilitoribacter nigricans]|uniref:Choline monooxygenase n=1 Tax=Flavilitoribacter nigricans (strain ATCC 23147 / DSM 23189 / NBRC 102662 / NCIMB 1420 / SS-2) TaxID=1122177 RepID=A0A2D0N535_FLAN2|nr:aromatic ring-hydroxylating dioxygenase subunit alpha [Flavilitoribacter nigricans]PHN03496.1 choline monooxygenase [Flavilitoribacter nigricans DSM 23189 = NBRC 102662]
MASLKIHNDIRQANTLPSSFYRDPAWFERTKENIFARTWHYVADVAAVSAPGQVLPFTLLDGVLDEPLVLTHSTDGRRYCLSNVCTHRGKIVVESAGKMRLLSCGYHGRCFRLDGSFRSMPAFEQVENFPSREDDLHQLPYEEWLGLGFVALDPVCSLEEMTRPMRERLSWLPLDTLEFRAEGSVDYEVNTHWALYCDNYLEGFHIPFVHPALNQAVDFAQYAYEVYPYCNLQTAVAGEGEPYFDIPPGAADHGRKIYAYYYWLFPNMMFNFYPWGLSLNIVEPLGPDRTRVRFRTYYFRDTPFERSANNLHETEMEDEAVVESVQRGMKSRFYRQGRFSPSMEQGVHHFHRLIADFL